jgi:site-specific recombinase XerD
MSKVVLRGSAPLDFLSGQSVHVSMRIFERLPLLNTGPTLDEIVRTYLYSCEVEGKTLRTLQAYAETLGQFLDAAKEERFPDNVAKINATHIYAFLGKVKARGVSAVTQHRRYRETHAFFTWNIRMGNVQHNPFDGVPNIRPEVKVVQPFTHSDIERLLDQCDLSTEFGVRTRAMILLLLDTGVRRDELERLDIDDVDLELGRAMIRHGKGRKQRVVSFSIEPAKSLTRYIDKYRGTTSGPLFLGVDRGVGREPLKKDHLGTLFQRLGAKAGIRANPHRFRHTFATWAIEAGAREIDVQYLLGHSTAFMTRKYAATYDASKAAAKHNDFSPVRLFGLE